MIFDIGIGSRQSIFAALFLGLAGMSSPAWSGGLAGEESTEAVRGMAVQNSALTLPAGVPDGDSLYVGDGSSNTIKRFSARTGHYLGDFVASTDAAKDYTLAGPRGLIFALGKLYVVNQDTNLPYPGELLRFQGRTGEFVDRIVPHESAHAPYAPRGMIRGIGRSLYVANYVPGPTPDYPNGDFSGPGALMEFDADSGAYLGAFDFKRFGPHFWPRGVVLGPDGLLYVTTTGNWEASPADLLSGYILRFNPFTRKYVDTFASFDSTTGSSSAGSCAKALHRPEGLVFGPDGRLYVTSFRVDVSDNDRILVYDVRSRRCVDTIELGASESSGATRAAAQALIFGPGGRLFVPTNLSRSGATAGGEIRRYDVRTKRHDVFVSCDLATHCPAPNPWYLIFGQTDPRTLEYND